MEERLSITNFLAIKKADLKVNKINILIGPQAVGKSILAKLLYFFKSIPDEFFDAIRSQDLKRELDKKILSNFEKRFPRYAWNKDRFKLSYQSGSINITISGNVGARGKTNLSISYSENLQKIFNRKKTIYKRRIEEQQRSESPNRKANRTERSIFIEHIVTPLRNGEYAQFFSNSVFIPASRSFFANLQNNIFTFLAENIEIDPYLQEFGRLYENTKKWYKDDFLYEEYKNLFNQLYQGLEAVIDGDYELFEKKDWIINKGKRVNLANASSGQQESLPMLLALCVWPTLQYKQDGSIFFIEEPEAHLFPNSQAHIVSMLSILHSKLGTNFFITTHSPYILSAINNYILAADAINTNPEKEIEIRLSLKSGSPIEFDDISAYTINKGELISVKDAEYRVIGGEVLDKISEEFEDITNSILKYQG